MSIEYTFNTASKKLLEMEKEAQGAKEQLNTAQMREYLGELINKSPSRARGRFTADFSLTPEYEELNRIDTSTLTTKQLEEHSAKLFSLKKYGTFTDEMRQAEIDNSVAIPLSEVVKLRDRYRADIEKLEEDMDNFDVSDFNRKAEELRDKYQLLARGKSGMQLFSIQSAYDKEYDTLKFEEYTKPYNTLAVKRYEKIELYKVYENRIKLYVSLNKNAINKQIEVARNAEISENLLALAEYMEE